MTGRLFLLLFLLMFTRAAYAQEVESCPASSDDPGQTKAIAGRWYSMAVDYVDSEEWLPAIRCFLCSYRHAEHPNTAYNLAQAAQELGEPDIAVFFFSSYLKLSPYADDSEEVQGRIRELKEKSGSQQDDDVSGLQIRAMMDSAVSADSRGEYEQAADGYMDVVRASPMDANSTQILARVMEIRSALDNGTAVRPIEAPEPEPEADQDVSAEPVQSEEPVQQPEHDNTMDIAGWSLIGGGGAMIVAGAVLAGVYYMKKDNVENAEAGTSFSDVKDDYESAEGIGIGGVVCLAAGAAAALAGGYILIFETDSGAKGSVEARIQPAGTGIMLQADF